MTEIVDQRIAIITGGASGIGFAIARKYVENGVKVILIGRDKTRLKLACETLGPSSGFIGCDLSVLKDLPEVVRSIKRDYGRIDILVNNAGVHLKKPIHEVTDEDYRRVIDTNQTAMFSLTREVSAVMKEQCSGVILNISSMASQYGLPYVIAYTASKSAIEGMTRALAVELAQYRIRVNCVAPGFIKTNMSSLALEKDPERKKKVLSRTPLGRLGKPEEVADAAWFLVSPSSSYITGVVLPVDGGNSIGF
ncbi:MAG TPA: SDR family oxidoreductase [Bacteroidales bacterium]|nr:SDR family oxidoreductase [Bacteroidales bacterium]